MEFDSLDMIYLIKYDVIRIFNLIKKLDCNSRTSIHGTANE